MDKAVTNHNSTRVQSAPKQVWTLQDIMNWSKGYLSNQGVERPRLDVEYLLSFVLDMTRVGLHCHADRPLMQSERDRFRELLIRRGKGEPLAYLLGTQPFMGNDFYVNSDVLIPRLDSEVLVEKTIDIAHGALSHRETIRALDVGTGSGCLILSFMHANPKVNAEAWDISRTATEVARHNANVMNLGERIDIHERDALEESNWVALQPMPFDLIISNPPYIAPEDGEVEEDVATYEPKEALYASNNGLRFYSFFAANAAQALTENGYIVMEIGHRQGEEVTEIFLQRAWRNIKMYNDTQGLNRVIVAQKPIEGNMPVN